MGVFALVLAFAALFTGAPQPATITASDGVPLSCSVVEPDGAPPAGGWPAVILFHGLGQSHADVEPIATQALAPAGFAALMCDARGTGASGGVWGLDGPREDQDARDVFNWLAARPEISDTAIGALGLSLGGGAVWNAAAAGVPFKAIVPMITWTDLQAALAPNGLAKSLLIQLLALAVPAAHWDPALLAAEPSLLQSNLTAIGPIAAARSVASKLPTITTPTLLVQGRHDFLFDIDQAAAAFRRLGGPKELYIGDLGHPPAANPPAELPTLYGVAAAWLGRHLRGSGSTGASVQLAHDPWDGKTTTYNAVPPTKTISVELPGTTVLKTGSSVARGVRLTGGPHETFGGGTVTVRYSNAKGWDHLVAAVTVAGSSTPITEGGVKVTASSGTATIHLLDESVLVPAGRRLLVTLSATSDVYGVNVPAGSSITIGRETLKLSVLTRAVSR
jgi:alpha-beta hydrolase superfamily lysophospholipase